MLVPEAGTTIEMIAIAGVLAILLGMGLVLGLIRPNNFNPRWLLVAIGFVLLNDMLLTNAYGLVPDLLPGLQWNWQGKILALAATLLLARTAIFGWRCTGVVLRQTPGSLKSVTPVAMTYFAFFAAVALAFPSDPASKETIAFQLTMPGLEEETFYRGLLLVALDRAYLARVRIVGVDWGWGAPLSCMLFGLAHAFGYSDDAFTFDPAIMALTTIPSFIAVWLRYRTGSLLLPVLLHNAGNSASFLL